MPDPPGQTIADPSRPSQPAHLRAAQVFLAMGTPVTEVARLRGGLELRRGEAEATWRAEEASGDMTGRSCL